MIENEDLFSIIEAIVYLNEGRTIKSVCNSFMNYFRLVDGRIRVVNNNTKYYLSLEEFKSLYINNKFMLHESNIEDTVDLKKDEEYYSWTNK